MIQLGSMASYPQYETDLDVVSFIEVIAINFEQSKRTTELVHLDQFCQLFVLDY